MSNPPNQGPPKSQAAPSKQAPLKPQAAPSKQDPRRPQAAPPSQAAASAPTMLTDDDAYWREMAKRLKKGDRVRRGRDWWNGDEGGGPGAHGKVTDKWYDGWSRVYICTVQWGNGHTGQYRMGGIYGGVYQLEIV